MRHTLRLSEDTLLDTHAEGAVEKVVKLVVANVTELVGGLNIILQLLAAGVDS